MKLSGELLVKFSFQPLKRSKTVPEGAVGIIWRGTKKGSSASLPPVILERLDGSSVMWTI